jgi:hypothetical protein
MLMTRRALFALITALLVVAALAAPSTLASAYAAPEQSTFGCDFFSSSGTSDASYVYIYVYIVGTMDEEYYTVVPVVNGHYSGQLTFPKKTEGATISYQVWGAPANVPIYDPLFWDDGPWSDTWTACSGSLVTNDAEIEFAGPGLPSGFALKTITCDVALFDAPGGHPVGDNVLKLGQTWYVNPETRADGAGVAWTEVFVSSYQNGYVPASCVN